MAFYLQASIALVFLAGSSAPTPLYGLYHSQWGFPATVLTLVFATYAVAVLVALLFSGRLSDHVGRRAVLMAAACAGAYDADLRLRLGRGGTCCLPAPSRACRPGRRCGLWAPACSTSTSRAARSPTRWRRWWVRRSAAWCGPYGAVSARAHASRLLPARAVFLLRRRASAHAESAARGGRARLAEAAVRLPAAVHGRLLLAAPALIACGRCRLLRPLGPTLVRRLAGSYAAWRPGVVRAGRQRGAAVLASPSATSRPRSPGLARSPC